ncbi:MAG: cytochrome c maturation protein CcmE, partial [Pseudomonadota bacterium]
MKPVKRNQRLILLGAAALAGAGVLVTSALNDNLSYFYSPLQIANGEADLTRSVRLGGLVAEGSIVESEDLVTEFVVTDGAATIDVAYRGVLPDLFREGQGVIAQGRIGENG